MIRSLAFCVIGLSAGLPFIWFAITNKSEGAYHLPKLNGMTWLVGGLVYIGGAMIYAFKVPERYVPNKFDYVGWSH